MHIPADVRFAHGFKAEQDFRDYFNQRRFWRCYEIGQNVCDQQFKTDLHRIKVPVTSDVGQQIISLLPETWRPIYQRGIGNSIPCLSRWDADAICIFSEEPQFFAEIKSSITPTNNITVELSCYLSALANQLRLGLPMYFFFSPHEKNPHWTYLTLDQIPKATVRVLDGKGCSGSATPFALISKDFLTQTVDDLCFNYEQDWLL